MRRSDGLAVGAQASTSDPKPECNATGAGSGLSGTRELMPAGLRKTSNPNSKQLDKPHQIAIITFIEAIHGGISMTKLVTFGMNKKCKNPTKENLGGKGYGLVCMSQAGIPVPAGFILPTSISVDENHDFGKTSEAVMDQLVSLEKQFGYMPLLSVRSGARVSMPGMMDTVLNVGLTDKTIKIWEKRIGKRAAWDSYRRLYQMYGDVVLGVSKEMIKACRPKSKKADSALTVKQLQKWVANLSFIVELPQIAEQQLGCCVMAVIESWNTPRAKAYRKLHSYPETWGTAVNIQAMVFGNMNDKSCSGVLFTRNPSTGAREFVGEYLVNAQGEDVVAGIRTPLSLDEMATWSPELHEELLLTATTLEETNQDMQDIEFTVQDGKLYILQTRNGKRSAKAAFNIAYDLFTEGVVTKAEALTRVTLDQYYQATKPSIVEDGLAEADMTGLPASTGIVTGLAVFSSEAAMACTEPCILITKETTPDDLEGMIASVGILTATGGVTSHAAVVARSLDKVCITGCDSLNLSDLTYINSKGFEVCLQDTMISMDGESGRVWVNNPPMLETSAHTTSVESLREWALDAGGEDTYTKVGVVPSEKLVLRKGGKYYVDTVTIDHLSLPMWRGEMKKLLKAVGEVGNTVAIQLKSDTADTGFHTSLFGAEAHAVAAWEPRIKWLAKQELPNNVVFVSASNGDLDTKDLPLVRNVKTIADLMQGGSVMLSEGFIEEIVGGDTAMSELLTILTTAGHSITQVNAGLTELQKMKNALG